MENKKAIALGSLLLGSTPIINATANTIGIAKTGTAIGSLSGAAHTSATAAWIGFGSMKVGMFIMGVLPVIGGLILLNGICQHDHGVPIIDWYEKYWQDHEIDDELRDLQQRIKLKLNHPIVPEVTLISPSQVERRLRELESELGLHHPHVEQLGEYLG
jgi:hypothetical protein